MESIHQQALIRWAASQVVSDIRVGDYLFAIPNGGLRSRAQGAALKREGVKAGVSDLFLPVVRGGFAGLWIEMKAPMMGDKPAGKPTSEQIAWLSRMGEQGYAAVVCHGWIPAAETITSYLECGTKCSA